MPPMYKLGEAAVRWWNRKCPSDMSFEEHLKYPTANCLIQSDYELANEVADFIKQTKIEEEQDASKLLRH